MATTSTLLNTFKVKIDDAVALVPTMVAEEKLKAVQFWNVISERLQEIVNNSAADISALAFELEKQNAAKSTGDGGALSKGEEPSELKLSVASDDSLALVDQQVNSQLGFRMDMTERDECKDGSSTLLPPPPSHPPTDHVPPSFPTTLTKDSTLPEESAGQILQSALTEESSMHIPPPPPQPPSQDQPTLSGIIPNQSDVFIAVENIPKIEKKPAKTKKNKLNSPEKWETGEEKLQVIKSQNSGKNKSLPNLRRQSKTRSRKKKSNVTTESDGVGSDVEASVIPEKVCLNGGCVEEKTESEDGAQSLSKLSGGECVVNEVNQHHSSGIILMNAKSLRGTGEGECFDDAVVIDEDGEGDTGDAVMELGGAEDDDEEEEDEEGEENDGEPFLNEDGHYICFMCKKSFVSMAVYTAHKCSHGKAYTCNECQARFSTRGNLIVHLRRHTGEKPFNCAQCHSKFSTKGNLKRHIKTHSGERPWECPQCGGRFTEKKSLKVHMRRHTGEKPYSCRVCGKQFAQTGILQTHMAMHMDQKEHLCEHCGKSFRQKSQLRLHMMRHEGVRKFQCNSCPSKFLTKGDLERHNRTHTGERPFVCELCGKTFTRQQSLNEHMNRHYGIKPYECKYCAKGFAEMSACYKHIKQHERFPDNASTDGDTQQLNAACDTKKMTVLVHDQSLEVGSEISVQQEQNNSGINEESDISVVPDTMGDFTAMNLLANASSFQQSY